MYWFDHGARYRLRVGRNDGHELHAMAMLLARHDPSPRKRPAAVGGQPYALTAERCALTALPLLSVRAVPTDRRPEAEMLRLWIPLVCLTFHALNVSSNRNNSGPV